MFELNLLLKNERYIGARSSSCNIVGAIIGGIGSIAGGLLNSHAQRSANSTNYQINRENNQFNARQNELDRIWNREENRYAQQNQFDMLQYQIGHEQAMWERNNAYNDPSAQRARFEAAGINPYIAMHGQGGGVAATSAQVPSVPSVPQASGMTGRGASSPIPMQPVTPFNGILQGISTFTNALDTLASAKKKGVETTRMEKMLSDEMRKLSADADTSQYMAIISKANSEVANEKARKQMEELSEKIKLLKEQVFNAGEEGKLITEKSLRETEERYLAIAKRNLARGEYDLIKKNIDAFDERLKVELAEGRSRIVNNYASASEHSAGASLKLAQKKTEDLTRDDKVAILGFDRRLKSIIHEYKIDPQTGKYTSDDKKGISIALYSALNEAYRLGYITEEEAGTAAFQGLDQALKVLGGISDAVGNVAKGLK